MLKLATTALAEAATKLKKKANLKPVIIVEDIHSVKPLKPDQGHPPGSEFAGQLVDLYARGLVNVVYTVSDFSALSLLSSGNAITLYLLPIF